MVEVFQEVLALSLPPDNTSASAPINHQSSIINHQHCARQALLPLRGPRGRIGLFSATSRASPAKRERERERERGTPWVGEPYIILRRHTPTATPPSMGSGDTNLCPEILSEVNIRIPHVFFQKVRIKRKPHVCFLHGGHHYIHTLFEGKVCMCGQR